jgi:hypothetical protein
MEIDVLTELEIARPRADVAVYASDPDNATRWYRSIKRVEWVTPKPLQVGSKLDFIAHFLGRTVAYTYEVKEMTGERFVMATSDGPFAMETTYAWSDSADGGTKMTLRNRGRPSGFGKVAAPMMTSAIRRANAKDLARLKEILES